MKDASFQTKLLSTKEVFYNWSFGVLEKLIFKGASASPTPTQGTWDSHARFSMLHL